MGLMNLKTMRLVAAAALLATAALLAPAASGQASSASCTTALLTSFTPCFSFLTNSSSNGASPTRECCRSLAALMNASTGCACLVLTGAVALPGLGGLGVPVNRTLALSLPKACGADSSVPLQCRDASPSPSSPAAQSPGAAGPVAADTPATTTPASPAATTPEAPATPTTEDPTATAPVSQGGQTRQTVLPSSAGRRTTTGAHVAAALLLAGVAAGALV